MQIVAPLFPNFANVYIVKYRAIRKEQARDAWCYTVYFHFKDIVNANCGTAYPKLDITIMYAK